MKKRMLCMCVAMVSAMAAAAQPKAGTISIIPRIGVTLAKVSGDEVYTNMNADGANPMKPKFRSGLMAGADVEYQLTDQLAVSLGGYYSRQGARYDDYIRYQDEENTKWEETKKMHSTYDYVNVPLMISAYPTHNFALKVGVQLGVNINGKFEQTTGNFEKDDKNKVYIVEDFNTSSQDVKLKKLDVSIPFGASYEYMNVILDARYNLGLTKIYDSGISGKNSYFTFNVAYRFQL